MKIAVVGAGIAGLSCAWRLACPVAAPTAAPAQGGAMPPAARLILKLPGRIEHGALLLKLPDGASYLDGDVPFPVALELRNWNLCGAALRSGDSAGQYGAIASIEMFEAVGQAYWPGYFACIARNLKPGGGPASRPSPSTTRCSTVTARAAILFSSSCAQ